MKIASYLAKMGYKAQRVWIRHGDKIMVAIGTTGLITAGVCACAATRRLDDIIDESTADIDDIKDDKTESDAKDAEEGNETQLYPDKEYKRDLALAYGKAGGRVVLLYGPYILLATASTICIVAGHHMLNNRYTAAVAAYNTVYQSFNEYRKRVIADQGEDKDREYYYGMKKDIVTEKVKDPDTGKMIKKSQERWRLPDGSTASPYAFIFDETSPYWQKDSEHNRWFVERVSRALNDKLNARGWVTINDVYDAFGREDLLSGEGQNIGWRSPYIYEDDFDKENCDGYIDFKLYEIWDDPSSGAKNGDSRKQAFIDGAERSVVLDMNYDGWITDKI